MSPSLFERPFAGTPRRGTVWILSRVVGAATFLSIIWLVNTDAHRPLKVCELTAIADRAVYGQVHAISSMLAGGPSGPATSGGGGGGSQLAAGVAATVAPYLMPSRTAGRSAPAAGSVLELTSLKSNSARGALPFRAGMRLAGQLVTHTEKRLIAVYLLRLARSDSLLGPSLTRSFVDCETLPVPPIQPIQPLPPVLPLQGHAPTCDGVTNAGMFSVNSATLPELAEYIADEVGTGVIDRTGIRGRFNATLTWRTDGHGPSIFTALRQQFGLRLDVTTETMDVQVVDKVESLTPRLK